eukprot:IDg16659t1
MGLTARYYAKQSEAMYRAETKLTFDIVQIVAVGLGHALAQCKSETVRYVLIGASKFIDFSANTVFRRISHTF